MPIPTVDEIDRITRIADPVLRNLRITHCYHELSLAVAARATPGANWCTFATWASRQAGQTIRGEDLARAADSVMGAPEVRALIEHAVRLAAGELRGTSIDGLTASVRRILDPEAAFRRASDAVAAGNLKVFDEIGREFARWLATAAANGAPDTTATESYCSALRAGDPPQGQRLLREAFAAYGDACAQQDSDARAERLFLANLLIGLHEQTRLQPEIAASLNAALDAEAIRPRLLELLLPQPWVRWRRRIARWMGRRPPLDDAIDKLIAALQRRIRLVITECLMTLRLPDRILRLGADVPDTFPPGLMLVEYASLRDVLAKIDPTPDSPVGSGANDWSSLNERIHFIADFFRTWHARREVLESPFDDTQIVEMLAGRVPGGRL